MLKVFSGARGEKKLNGESITIFFMSFVFPVRTGYLKRMELIVNWANESFDVVNFIIPTPNWNIPDEKLKDHLPFCNSLYLVRTAPKSKLDSILNVTYKCITGRFAPFYSSLFLSRTLIRSFSQAINESRTDYFLNTRHNFAGLVKFLPYGMKPIIDTQDIFTDLYSKYSVPTKNKYLKKIFLGYNEKGDFFRSEIEILNQYKLIIAISDNDFNKYKKVEKLSSKVVKIESVGIRPRSTPVVSNQNPKYDLLIVGSNFYATQKGFNWFINEVAVRFNRPLSLCVVGSLGDYINEKKFNCKNLKIDVKGTVDLVDEFYEDSKIVLILILEGTGTSVKGIEALSYGAATVSTSAGVRFGSVVSGRECFISDESEEFANHIERLIEDEAERLKLGKNALIFANWFSTKSSFSISIS